MSENIIKGRKYYEIADILNTFKIDKKTANEIVENFIRNNLILTTHAYEYILKNKLYEKGCIENIIKTATDNQTGIVTEEFIIEFCIKKEEKSDEESEKLKGEAELEENIGCMEEEKKEENKEGEEKTKEELKPKEGHKEEPKEKHKEEPKEKHKEEPKEKHKEEPKEEPKEKHKEEPKEKHKEEPKEENKGNKRLAIKSDFKIFDYKCASDGKISDFSAYFKDKYKTLSTIIRKKVEYRGATDIEKIKEGEKVSIIGMVSDKFENKEGTMTLTVDDLTGNTKIIISKGMFSRISPDVEKVVKGLVYDEVIGAKGKVANGGKAIFASELVEPDMPHDFVPNKAKEEIYTVFTSDLHIGSIFFLQKEFENFLEWLNLKKNRIDIAEKVKYILIAGDIVDGVGVYPHQDKELALSDIFKQYDFAADLISRIPEDIEIIISTGNHDAVRIAEPQLKINKKFAPKFYDMKNVHLVGNPAYVSIEGVNILMYHGEALDNLIRAIPGLSYSSPEIAMKEFLKKRHLSPIYKDIFPSEKDYLAIENIPDVIISGHVHAIGYGNYRGVHLINSGCFQGRTKFQEEMGHIPTPSKVPVMNLKTHDITWLDFGEN